MSADAHFAGLPLERPAPHVLRITIDNPAQMNALNRSLLKSVHGIWDALDADPLTRVAIITCAGQPTARAPHLMPCLMERRKRATSSIMISSRHVSSSTTSLTAANHQLFRSVPDAELQQTAPDIAGGSCGDRADGVCVTKYLLNSFLRKNQDVCSIFRRRSR